MKKLIFSTLALIALVAAPLQAGTEIYKQVAPPPPPPMYGLGFYGAIDMGANVYQNRGGDQTFTVTTINDRIELASDATLEVSPKNDVGFFGGIKLGYVFGTGVVRPTIEGDFFYNGFRGGADFTLRDIGYGDALAQRNVTTWINTGAFMANFILRFAPGNQKFQPYAGAGVGIYYAESAGVEVNDPVTGVSQSTLAGGQVMRTWRGRLSPAQITFCSPQWSAFIEYHYLDYTSTQIETNQSRDLGQHLVGAGVRFFFH